MSTGNFFAIGADEFSDACKLGMNTAVSLLVMARGTGRDNSTTAWSALSIFNHSGIARRRAQTAIETLAENGLIEIIQKGLKPRYRLKKPDDDQKLIWLPNELIDGAGREIPPITKLRECGNLTILEKYIQLYGLQDLDNDGGLPRSIARVTYDRELICQIAKFKFFAFTKKTISASHSLLFKGFENLEDEDGNKGPWTVLTPLIEMGLVEYADYMAESSVEDSELIYPVNESTLMAMDELASWLEEMGGYGYAEKARQADFTGIAVSHVSNATMVGLLRLKYRPKTGKTSRWWAIENEQSNAVCAIVEDILLGRKAQSVHIKANQG